MDKVEAFRDKKIEEAWPSKSRSPSGCKECGRLHLQDLPHLDDRRWWDADATYWRDGRGDHTMSPPAAMPVGAVKVTRVVLATAHQNHDTSDNRDANLAAFCQRCHTLHDRPEHQWRRRITLPARRALGDLFGGICSRL